VTTTKVQFFPCVVDIFDWPITDFLFFIKELCFQKSQNGFVVFSSFGLYKVSRVKLRAKDIG